MKTDIILINPLYIIKTGNIWKEISSCLPPLGLASLTPYLEMKGYSVKIIDAEAFQMSLAAIHTPDRPFIPDINMLPFPAYHLLPMDKYYPARGSYKRLPAISIMINRGCPGKCTFYYPEKFGKKILIQKTDKIIYLTKKAGIEVRTTFMLGNPGETLETLNKTLDYCIKLDPDVAIFNITTPYPGTKMCGWTKKNGYLSNTNWLDYNIFTAKN